MYHPNAKYDEVAEETHAYETAHTRYGINLTWGDLYEISLAVDNGKSCFMYESQNAVSHREVHAVEFHGKLLPVVVGQNSSMGTVIITFLPIISFAKPELKDDALSKMRFMFGVQAVADVMKEAQNMVGYAPSARNPVLADDQPVRETLTLRKAPVAVAPVAAPAPEPVVEPVVEEPAPVLESEEDVAETLDQVFDLKAFLRFISRPGLTFTKVDRKRLVKDLKGALTMLTSLHPET